MRLGRIQQHTLFLILVLVLSSCQPFTVHNINPEFRDNVQLFESLYNIKVNVSIRFSDNLSSNVNGKCKAFVPNYAGNIIEINSSFWDNSNFYGRQQVLLHELGHCVLGLKHRDTMLNGIPTSIMNSYSFGNSSIYKDNLQYYYNELYVNK